MAPNSRHIVDRTALAVPSIESAKRASAKRWSTTRCSSVFFLCRTAESDGVLGLAPSLLRAATRPFRSGACGICCSVGRLGQQRRAEPDQVSIPALWAGAAHAACWPRRPTLQRDDRKVVSARRRVNFQPATPSSSREADSSSSIRRCRCATFWDRSRRSSSLRDSVMQTWKATSMTKAKTVT